MEIESSRIIPLAEVEPGTLFVLAGGPMGAPLCFRASYKLTDEEDGEEADRVIPLHWPENQESVGLTVYRHALSGRAVVLEGARLHVNPMSARSLEVASTTAVYARDGKLFLPSVYKGKVERLVDATTGEILPSFSGRYVAFEEWSISVPDPLDADSRITIFPIGGASPE